MGKIYFVAEIHCGEDVVTSPEIYNMKNDDGTLMFKNVFGITSAIEFEKAPNRDEFIQQILTDVKYHFTEDGNIDEVSLIAIDINTHRFLWGVYMKMEEDDITYNVIDWTKDGCFFTYYKDFKVTNNVTYKDYIQWLEGFVRRVICDSKIECSELIIDDIEPSKRIFLVIDGEDYTIRTWNFHVIDVDDNGNPWAEAVRYSFYKMVEDKDGMHGEEISDGILSICWDND